MQCRIMIMLIVFTVYKSILQQFHSSFIVQDKACEEIDYEVQSSSGSDEEEEAGEALQESEEGSSEDEEVERQRRAVAEKEKVTDCM